MLHAMETIETSLLSSSAFLTAIYVDPRYQALLKYSRKTVAQAHLEALWRRLQTLHESVDTTDVECLGSSSVSENGFTPPCGFDIIDEILAALDACNAISSQSPRDMRNVIEMIKCFNNQARLLRNRTYLNGGTSKPSSILNQLLMLLLLYR